MTDETMEAVGAAMYRGQLRDEFKAVTDKAVRFARQLEQYDAEGVLRLMTTDEIMKFAVSLNYVIAHASALIGDAVKELSKDRDR